LLTIGRTTAQRLLAFNRQMLDQALAVVDEHAAPDAPPFAGPVGAHLRHVIEHYEALVDGLRIGVADYDGRPRDRQLEASATLARHRLVALRYRLGQCTPEMLDWPVQVLGQGGAVGDFDFSVASSLGRELAFLASHAVHHFALLAVHLQQHGLAVPAHFGKAPGTVANEIATRRAAAPLDIQPAIQFAIQPDTQPETQELACPSPALSA
jgi:hypothetical protein